jgi:DNA modification methylase
VTPYLSDPDLTLYVGDAGEVLAALPEGSVDCCVTSPPYFGLRDYGVEGQIGLEPTPEQYVARLVDVFRGVRQVLAPYGVVWLNLGDSYAQGHGGSSTEGGGVTLRKHARGEANPRARDDVDVASWSTRDRTPRNVLPGTKPKDLLGIPWRVALALQADGWWLRSDVVWSKPNPMPESVTDRPTRSHEYLFLLTKAPRYYWDAEAVREPDGGKSSGNGFVRPHRLSYGDRGAEEQWTPGGGRNIRSVWTIPTQPFPEAHFATFPEELARRAIAAGCPERVCETCGEPSRRVVDVEYENPGNRSTNGPRSLAQRHESPGFGVRLEKRTTTTGWTDCGHGAWRPGVVLDPFMGSGTVAVVARRLGRRAVGIELSPDYAEMIARRTRQLSLLWGSA